MKILWYVIFVANILQDEEDAQNSEAAVYQRWIQEGDTIEKSCLHEKNW